MTTVKYFGLDQICIDKLNTFLIELGLDAVILSVLLLNTILPCSFDVFKIFLNNI